jgi:type I restriction enzyme M protein
MTYEDLTDFLECYNPENRHDREETERFKAYEYDDLIERDKTNLDIFWLKDDSLEDTENLPEPDVLASDIVENLGAALEQFRGVQEELSAKQAKEQSM